MNRNIPISSGSHGQPRLGDISEEKASVSSHEPVGTKARRLERKSTEEINKCADDFIKKFRQQLLLERLESMENFQQKLQRGT